MNTRWFVPIAAIGLLIVATSFEPYHSECGPEWGFFGHRRINRLAVMTLPPDMMRFYKKHIDYLTDHAPDPDMRRYAVNWEAPRHYIDLDEYEGDTPREWPDALLRYCEIKGINKAGDTIAIYRYSPDTPEALQKNWRHYMKWQVHYQFNTDDKKLDADSLRAFAARNQMEIPDVQAVFFTETLSAHGILPWNLQNMQKRLTEAFRQRDGKMILKLSADMGHYVGDAHVPLHTTSNYNGQKTNQYGIHGFWESRIPELFADQEYDYFVGKPNYIGDPADFFWGMVMDSHALTDSVLSIERRLRTIIPEDNQICPDVRNGMQVLTQCRDFARAYQTAMRGMVESRMRSAIHSVASAWMSAWVDAGSPDLSQIKVDGVSAAEDEEQNLIRRMFGGGKIIGRPEDH